MTPRTVNSVIAPQEKAKWALGYVRQQWTRRVLPMTRAIKKIEPGQRSSMLRTLAEDIHGLGRAIEEAAALDAQRTDGHKP